MDNDASVGKKLATKPINITHSSDGGMNDNVTVGTQDIFNITVSSLQSSFQQEIERANTMRKEAAEATAASLTKMQTEVNKRN